MKVKRISVNEANLEKVVSYRSFKADFERGLIRWECIRRDPEYKKAYSAHRDFNNLPREFMLHPDTTRKDLKKLFNRYDAYSELVADYISTERQFPKDILTKDSLLLAPRRRLAIRDVVGFINILGYCGYKPYQFFFQSSRIIEHGKVEYDGEMPVQATFTINLSYFKEDVKTALFSEIDSLYKVRKDLKGKAERKDEYEQMMRCLEVYDIDQKRRSQKTKKTIDQMAEEIYKGPYKLNAESTKRQVNREVKCAKYLIAGGYVNIK